MARRSTIAIVLAVALAGTMQQVDAERLRVATAVAAIKTALFAEQLAAHNDACRFKVIWTTRRAGKTYAALCDWLIAALKHPYTAHAATVEYPESYYVAVTLSSARRIAWNLLKSLDKRFQLGIRFQEAQLRATLPNGLSLSLFGADKPGLSERLYGTAILRVYIDEAAFYTIDIGRELVDRVLLDAVSDVEGHIWLLSIPGYLPRGLFFHLTSEFDWREKFAGRRPSPSEWCPSAGRWSVHRWTTDDNPVMRDRFRAEIARELADNPNAEKDPEFLRNKRGAWVISAAETVYLWTEDLNTFPGMWERTEGDNYALGIDFGYGEKTDLQALSLVCWRDDSDQLVEVESQRHVRLGMAELAAHVRAFMDEYPDLIVIGDPGSKQYFEEFRRAYNLPVIEAEKSGKHDWIEIVNSQFRAGRILIVEPARSEHVKEMTDLTWTRRPDGTKHETRGQANDACDAFLYAFRFARHYLRGEQPEPGPRTEAEINAQIEAELVALEEDMLETDDDWGYQT